MITLAVKFHDSWYTMSSYWSIIPFSDSVFLIVFRIALIKIILWIALQWCAYDHILAKMQQLSIIFSRNTIAQALWLTDRPAFWLPITWPMICWQCVPWLSFEAQQYLMIFFHTLALAQTHVHRKSPTVQSHWRDCLELLDWTGFVDLICPCKRWHFCVVEGMVTYKGRIRVVIHKKTLPSWWGCSLPISCFAAVSMFLSLVKEIYHRRLQSGFELAVTGHIVPSFSILLFYFETKPALWPRWAPCEEPAAPSHTHLGNGFSGTLSPVLLAVNWWMLSYFSSSWCWRHWSHSCQHCDPW